MEIEREMRGKGAWEVSVSQTAFGLERPRPPDPAYHRGANCPAGEEIWVSLSEGERL